MPRTLASFMARTQRRREASKHPRAATDALSRCVAPHASSSRGCVVVVDDDDHIAAAASVRLRAAGFETLAAHDGNEGIAAVLRSQPEAVVMDVRMPRMDGIEAAKQLR